MAAQQYSPAVAEYFWRPVRTARPDIRGSAGSEAAGTRVEVHADVTEHRLKNVGFRAFACPHIIASCNWLAEQLEGAKPSALVEVRPDELQQMFDIPVEKAGKLLILKDALNACYESYRQWATAGSGRGNSDGD